METTTKAPYAELNEKPTVSSKFHTWYETYKNKIVFSKPDVYAEFVGTIRVMEKKFMTKQILDQILDAPSVNEAIQLINQNSSITFTEEDIKSGVEERLIKDLFDAYDLFLDMLPESYLVDLLRQKYVFLNRKITAKNSITHTNESLLPIGDVLDFSSDLPDGITDPQEIDIFYDKEELETTIKLANMLKNDYIIEYYKQFIDYYNLLFLLRLKAIYKPLALISHGFVDGGNVGSDVFIHLYDENMSTIKNSLYRENFDQKVQSGIEAFEVDGHFGVLEKEIDNSLMKHVKDSRYIAFGPELPFAYLLAKENEIKQARLLITGKMNNIHPDILRERLRDGYA